MKAAAIRRNDQRRQRKGYQQCRSSARSRPSGCASSRTTAMRLSSWPKLPPASHDSSADSTKKTVKIIHARQPPPVITAVPKEADGDRHAGRPVDDQGADPCPPARQRPATFTWQAQTLAGIGLARRGRVRCFVRHVAEVTWRRVGDSLGCRSQPWQAPCYMRETFVQLDRNRISIRLPKTEGGTPIRVRPALPAQRRVRSIAQG